MIEVNLQQKRTGFTLDFKANMNGGLTAIFGPSGAGKSTVLNMIAGLAKAESGIIRLNGRTLFNSAEGINVPPHQRGIGYVFQDSLLFPHLTVKQNLTYGLKPGPASLQSVQGWLGISHILERKPATLSGGERQRVAIGRALLSAPKLLLMDEPLANLDMARKTEILPYIEQLHHQFSIPVIYVSHALEEVARLASEVVLMREGQVLGQGAPQAMLRASTSDASRFEQVSILTTTFESFDPLYGLSTLRHPAGKITVIGKPSYTQSPIRLGVRTTDVTLALKPPHGLSARTLLEGRLLKTTPTNAAMVVVEVQLKGGDILSAALTRKATEDLKLQGNQKIWCLLKTVSIDGRWLGLE